MEELLKGLGQYGILGIILAILFYYILKKEKDYTAGMLTSAERHAKERELWRVQSECQFNKIMEVTEKNTTVITELKMIIENKINR
jgi:hypothetical protein